MKLRGDLIGLRRSDDPQAVLAAVLGVSGAAMAAAGTFLDWFEIAIGGVTAPGGSATGWQGRDGRTVLAGAVVSVVAAALVVLDTRRLWPKIALIVAGFITGVIAIAGILDTRSKAEQVRDEFAIQADRVTAEVGAGLWLVAGGAIIELAGGVAARQPEGTAFRRAAGTAALAGRASASEPDGRGARAQRAGARPPS